MIRNGIDFRNFGIRNGTDFRNFGIRNGTGFYDFGTRNDIDAFSENWYKVNIYPSEQPGGGGVLGLRTYGNVPLENLKSYPVPESNSRK